MELSPGLPTVQGDRIQLQQVVLNLLLNAFDAVSEKPSGERQVLLRTWSEDSAVHASVADNGSGISDRGGRNRVRALFHDQVTGAWHGAIHQPLDHHSTQRPHLGREQHLRARGHLPYKPARRFGCKNYGKIVNDQSSTVFVVDDDASVRKGLVRLLKAAGYPTMAFPSADEFLAHWSRNPVPGCLLLDIMMPGTDGLQLQKWLQTAPHAIPIIFVTGHGDIPSTVNAMKAGAVDFLPKPLKEDALLKAITEAMSRDARQRRERAERESVLSRFETLTPREREVMALAVRGMLNKEIAHELGTSLKTVKIHRGRVMEKMKVQSIPDLLLAAQRIGIEDKPAV